MLHRVRKLFGICFYDCGFEIISTGTAFETLMIKSAFRPSPLWRFVCGCAARRIFSTSSRTSMFYEANRSGQTRKPRDVSSFDDWRNGVKLIGNELSKFKEEVIWNVRCDDLVIREHGDYEVIWKFDNSDVVNSWLVTSDQDNNEGNSTAEFVVTPNRRGLFRGRLDTTVPKDGVTKQTGYCNIRSPPNFVRFFCVEFV